MTHPGGGLVQCIVAGCLFLTGCAGAVAVQAQVSAAVAAAGSASLSGSVCDGSGSLVPGAQLWLRSAEGDPGRTTITDAAGRYRLDLIAPGSYEGVVSAPGLESAPIAKILLRAGEARELPEVTLAVPSDHAEVTVSVSRRELATEEVHAAEQQRVLGFPDFYTSFVPNPEPLDAGQKFGLALRSTTDTMSFVGAALVAGGEQIQNTFPSYGGGVRGYAKRYGAAYTDAFTGKMIGSALFPSVFRQDPRYFYQGTGTVRQRALHAVLSAVIARGDSGRMEPNYAHILGNASAGALSTLYHPATDSAGKLALDNALLGTLGEAGVNLVREFVLKHFMTGVPADAAGP